MDPKQQLQFRKGLYRVLPVGSQSSVEFVCLEPGLYPEGLLFLWLAIQDKLKTKHRLLQIGAIDNNLGPICGATTETVEHIFFQCTFSSTYVDNLKSCLAYIFGVTLYGLWQRKGGRYPAFKGKLLFPAYVVWSTIFGKPGMKRFGIILWDQSSKCCNMLKIKSNTWSPPYTPRRYLLLDGFGIESSRHSYCNLPFATVDLFPLEGLFPPVAHEEWGVQPFIESGYPFHTDANHGGSLFPFFLVLCMSLFFVEMTLLIFQKNNNNNRKKPIPKFSNLSSFVQSSMLSNINNERGKVSSSI